MANYSRNKPFRPRVDWSHPLAKNLIAVWMLADSKVVDLINGMHMTSVVNTKPTPKACMEGYCIDFGAGAGHFQLSRKTTYGPQNSNDAFTIMIRARCTNVGVNGCAIQFGEVTDSQGTQGIGVSTAAALTMTADGFGGSSAAGPTVTVNTWFTGGYSQTGTSARHFILNGVITTNATAITVATSQGGLSIGESYRNTAAEPAPWQGQISWIYCWKRALTDAEMLAIHANPYGFLTSFPSTYKPSSGAAVVGLEWMSPFIRQDFTSDVNMYGDSN